MSAAFPQVNKIDLAPAVGASLEVMRRDALMMRGGGSSRGGSSDGMSAMGGVSPGNALVTPSHQHNISGAGPVVFAQVAGTGVFPTGVVQSEAHLSTAVEKVSTEIGTATSPMKMSGKGTGVDEIVRFVEAALARAGVEPSAQKVAAI